MSTQTTPAPAVDQQRLVRLPKWAQKHIEELETRVRRAEQTIPWTEPGMEWFTVLHPATRAAEDKGKHRKIFMLGEDYAHPVCSIGPLDCVFVGRKAMSLPMPPCDHDECPPTHCKVLAAATCSPAVWRREPPDRPGWWLVEQAVTKQICALYFHETDLLHTALYDTRWWAGPLEPPPPPDCQGSIQS